MIKHYFIIIFRNILKDKVSSFINLTNLTVGFATFILLSMVVNHELNFNKFNEKYDRIYRVQTKQEDSYPTNFCTYSPPAFRYHLMADMPEVEEALLMREISGQYFALPDGNQLYDKYGYWCENTFFNIFTVRFKEGSETHALDEPNTIVLSETLAKKIFPNGGAVGNQVLIGKRHLLRVTAVFHDFPQNSDLKPSFLVSLSTYENMNVLTGFRDNWIYIDHDNYVLLKEGADPSSVNSKIKDAFKSIKNYERSSPYLHPLSKHHISPNNQSDSAVGLALVSMAALLVLILSCINYINLEIANSTKRAREIGIKKVVGCSKKAISYQFLSQTVFLTLLAMCLGLLVAQLASPLMGIILQRHFEYNILENKQLLLFIFGVSLAAGILSGLYPALVLSHFNPVKVLKGKFFNNNGKTVSLKKSLVIVQFSISLFMLIFSFILYRHVNFILNKNLGFDKNNIIFCEVNLQDTVQFETIRTKLLQHPEILDATFSKTIPYMGNIGGYVSWEGGQPDQKEMISRNYVNYDFIPTYDLKMAMGRNFSEEFPADNKSCIINETAMKAFGWDDPIDKQVFLYGNAFQVIGVLKDFHPFSVHNPIPVYLMFLKPNTLSGTQLITIRFAPNNEHSARQIATSELESILPNEPFEFKDFQSIFYLDKAISFWQSMKGLFLFFAVVALIISSMGLFGLMILTTKRRTKEMGIRKVLGSSVSSIYRQLSLEVMALLGFAVVFACPIAFYIYKEMPGAYKEPLNLSEFILPIILVAFVAFATISYHMSKVALNDPVDALRYE